MSNFDAAEAAALLLDKLKDITDEANQVRKRHLAAIKAPLPPSMFPDEYADHRTESDRQYALAYRCEQLIEEITATGLFDRLDAEDEAARMCAEPLAEWEREILASATDPTPESAAAAEQFADSEAESAAAEEQQLADEAIADGRTDAFHPTTVTILNYVLDEQRRDLGLFEYRLERANAGASPDAVDRFRTQIAELTAVVADFEELLRLIAQADAEAEQDRQIAENEACDCGCEGGPDDCECGFSCACSDRCPVCWPGAVVAEETGTGDPERARYIAGLRAMCDWLEANPGSPAPYSNHINIPLHTNAAVEAWADGYGVRDLVKYDDEGNASLNFMFGPVAMHVYGYRDFADHLERHAERRAQEYAAARGLTLVATDEQAGTDAPAAARTAPERAGAVSVYDRRSTTVQIGREL